MIILNVIILVLKSRKELFKEMRQKKSQERFKVSEGPGPLFLDLKVKKEGHEPRNEEAGKSP